MTAPIVGCAYAGGVLTVTWSPVPDATGYEAVVRAADGSVAARATPSGTTTSWAVPAGTLATGAAFVVRVRATTAGGPDAWSAPVPVRTVAVAAPTGTVAAEPGALLVTPTAPGADLVDLVAWDGARQVAAESGVPGVVTALAGTFAAGTTYTVTGRAWQGSDESDDATIGRVTVADVAAPTLALAFADGAVTASWTPVGALTTYEFELRTQAEPPAVVDHATVTAAPWQVRVGTGLVAGTTYQGRLRSWDGANASAWSTTTVSTAVLDARLAALRDRLAAARQATTDGSTPVDAATLGTDGAAIAASLLPGLGAAAVTFAPGATTAEDPVAETLTLTGTALTPVLGAAGAGLVATFGVAVAGLTLRLRVTTASGWTLGAAVPELAGTQLAAVTFDRTAGHEPAFTLDAGGLTFAGSVLLAGVLAPLAGLATGAPASVAVTGSPARGSGGVSLALTGALGVPVAVTIPGGAALAFEAPRLVLRGTAGPAGDVASVLGVEDEVELGGVRITLDLLVPTAARSWRIELGGAPVPVAALPAFLAACPGGGLAAALPDQVAALGSFAVTSLVLDLDDDRTGLRGFQVAIGPAGAGVPLWPVLPGIFEVSALRAYLAVAWPAGSPVVSGRISGTFLVGGSLATTVSLPLPLGSGDWLFAMSGARALPDLGGLAALLGGTAVADLLPSGVATVGGFDLTGLTAVYSPAARTLTSLDLVLDSSQPWPVVPDQLELSDVHVALHADHPLDAVSRRTSGVVSGSVVLDDDVTVNVTVSNEDAAWFLEVDIEPVALPSLDDLTALLGGTAVSDLLPSGLGSASFTLESLLVRATLAPTPAVTLVTLSLDSADDWPVVDPLSVAAPWAVLTLDWTSGHLVTTGALGGTLVLAEAELSVAAGYDGGWVVDAELLGPVTVPLAGLLEQFSAATDLVSPSGYGLPALQFTTATARVVPATGEVSVTLGSALEWPVGFGTGTDPLRVTGLGATFHRPGDHAADQAALTGTVTYHGFAGAVTLALGGAGVHTVVVVTVAPGGAPVALDAMASALAATGGEDDWDTLPLPADFTPTTLDGAGMELDLTARTLVLYGRSTAYGAAAGLLVRSTATGWAYAVGAALGTGTAGGVSAGLAPADAFFGLTGASAAIAVVSADAADLAPLVTRLPDLADVAARAGTGLNLAARLAFGTPVLANVTTVLPGAAATPGLVVHALVARQSKDSWFEATLDHYTLAGVVTFSGVLLRWTPAAEDTLTLRGTVTVTVDGVDYAFAGDMTVTAVSATFSVGTAQKIPAPLGMKGIDLDAAAITVTYGFPAGKPTTLDISLSGTVQIGSVRDLTGRLVLRDGTPVLAAVSVAHFSIAELFQQSVGTPWPATDFDPLVVDRGELYYCAPPGGLTTGGTAYLHGFNLDADLTIVGVGATVTVTVDPGRSLVVTGALDHPVDLGFARLTGATVATGPAVALTTGGQRPAYSLTAGLTLLDADLGPATLEMTKDETGAAKACATLRPNLPVFGSVPLTICWTKAHGLTFDGFPIGLAEQALQIGRLLSQKPGCVGQVILENLPIKAAYSFTSAWSVAGGAALRIDLYGHFDVDVLNSQALRVDLQHLTVSIPVPRPGTGFGWGDVPGWIAKTIVDNAYAVFAEVLRDPTSMAKLLAIEGVKYAAGALVDALVCEGWAESEATAFVDAAGSSVMTDVVVDGVAVAVGGVAVVIIGGLIVVGAAGGDHGVHPPDDPPHHPPHDVPPGAVGGLATTYFAGTLTLSWTAASGADGYHWQLVPATGSPVAGDTGALSASVPGTSLAWGATYTIEVYGTRGNLSGPTASQAVTVPSPLSEAQDAQRRTEPVGSAATRVKTDFPTVTTDQLTDALVAAYGLTAPATAAGPLASALHACRIDAGEARAELVRVLPGLTAAQLAVALRAAYGLGPADLAAQLAAFGAPPAAAAVALRQAFTDPALAATALGPLLVTVFRADGGAVAAALVTASYPLADVVAGVHAAVPAATAGEVAADAVAASGSHAAVADVARALVAAFTAPPLDAGALAAALRAGFTQPTGELPVASAADGVVAALPQATATAVGTALASAYADASRTEVLGALRHVFAGLAPAAAATALTAAYRLTATDVPGLVDLLHQGFGPPPPDPPVLAQAVAAALGLVAAGDAGPLARAVGTAYGLLADPAAAGSVAVVLRDAGFPLAVALTALPGLYADWSATGTVLVTDAYTSPAWVAAARVKAAGTPVAQACVPMRAAAATATATQLVAAMAGTWFLTTVDTGLLPIAASLKAATFPLEDAVTGLKARYGTAFTPTSFGRVLHLYNSETGGPT